MALCASLPVFGQPGAAPHFEVASIRPSDADYQGSSGLRTGYGRLTAGNVTLKRCIMGAYGVGPRQIIGGPNWLDSDRFAIAAKAEQPVGDETLMMMLRGLLAERFKLTFHRETRRMSAYALQVAKNGPRLEKGGAGESKTENGRGTIAAQNTSMDHFAEVLARQMELPVLNQTGLEGVFNLRLQWTREDAGRLSLLMRMGLRRSPFSPRSRISSD